MKVLLLYATCILLLDCMGADVTRKYSLTEISDDGYPTLIDEDGATKEDLKLPEGALGDSIREAFEGGADVLVTVVVFDGGRQQKITGFNID